MQPLISPHCISTYVIHKTATEVRYLLIRRCSQYLHGTWQMVSGGIEQGETASAAALREVQEETGLSPTALYSADAVETFYMQSLEKITLVPVFVAFVNHQDVILSPKEHDAYEWLSFEAAKDRLIWAEQKRVITHIHNHFILNQPNDLLLIKTPSFPSLNRPKRIRTGVYGVALRDEKILLVKQLKGPHAGKWDLPGGGVEFGETIEEALRREFHEEVGLSFETFQLLGNAMATTCGADEEGRLYELHQIGLIYRTDGLSEQTQATPELEHAWISLTLLQVEMLAPFAQQALALLQAASYSFSKK